MRNKMRTQKEMMDSEKVRILSTFNTFNEIMSSPNPLMKSEIERLIAKRPGRYSGLLAYLEKYK